MAKKKQAGKRKLLFPMLLLQTTMLYNSCIGIFLEMNDTYNKVNKT